MVQQAEVKQAEDIIINKKMITIEKLYTLLKQSNGVSTDSRNITPGSIFFALKGETFDGNEFVLQALDSGAAYAVTDDLSLPDNSRVIKTADSLKTLQQLAAHHRVVLGLQIGRASCRERV